jgi:hypothetical protein
MTNSPLINPPGPSSRAEQLTRDKEAAVEHSYNSENFSGLTKLLASAEAPHLYMYCSCLQVVRETGVLMPARHPGYDTMVALKRKEGKERTPAMRNNMFEDLPYDDRQQSSVRPQELPMSGGRHSNMTWKKCVIKLLCTC